MRLALRRVEAFDSLVGSGTTTEKRELETSLESHAEFQGRRIYIYYIYKTDHYGNDFYHSATFTLFFWTLV